MGGYGSGRWGFCATKATCDQMHSVDLAYLRRHDMLTPGKTGALTPLAVLGGGAGRGWGPADAAHFR
jgi:hypothetical protein